jgi:hypothetical protein
MPEIKFLKNYLKPKTKLKMYTNSYTFKNIYLASSINSMISNVTGIFSIIKKNMANVPT